MKFKRSDETTCLMWSKESILRRGLISFCFLLAFLLLNRPQVILLSHLGAVVWYPATGLTIALLLGLSPWYGLLAPFADALAGIIFYDQPLRTFSGTVGAVAFGGFYSAAAYVLRARFPIDLGLRRRQDVIKYILVTAIAALGSTLIGVLCLVADHAISWREFWSAGWMWFLGDEIGLLGIAPFLLIHVLPWVRRRVSEAKHTETPQSTSVWGNWLTLEVIGQTLALAVSLWVMFGASFGPLRMMYMCFVPILWIAVRQGVHRVTTGLLALNFGIVLSLRLVYPNPDLLTKTGLLMFVVSALGLVVGSAVTERNRIASELLDRTADLLTANSEMAVAKSRAEEASRVKSEFLANMSHEIRTPVNGILGLAELILQTELTREQREYLTMLKSSGDSLLGIINDVLDFSRVESGQLQLDPTEFDLRDAIAKTLRDLSVRAHEKRLALAYHVHPAIPDFVVGDPGRLRQILVNLVGNAIKFTQQGSVIVRVQIDSETPEGMLLHFAVEDTGIGIPKEKHALIFEAFTQADSSITRQFGGTGLGLSICSRLTGLMGGKVWLESTENVGSAFHFTVLFKVSTADNISAETWRPEIEGVSVKADRHAGPVSSASHSPTTTGLRVLIAEDNTVNQTVTFHMLQELGYSPTIAVNGLEALAALRTGEFDLILMDVQMPRMDGLTATHKIREQEKLTGEHIPIIALTAHAMKGDREQCLRLGMDAFIAKPVSSQVIRDTIEKIVAGRETDDRPADSCETDESVAWSHEDVLRRVGGDKRLLQELIEIFLEESPKQLAILEKAIEEDNPPKVQAAAHSLKGELGWLGLSAPERQARSLEALAGQGSLEGAAELISSFKTEMLGASAAMREVLNDFESAKL